jgi:bilirubin oxidase
MVQFEVVDREDGSGAVRRPEAWETGTKDTLVAFPGDITRVKATFDRAASSSGTATSWSTRTTR